MASNIKLGNAARSAACDGIVDRLDGGTIRIGTAAPPTNPGDADSGTTLGTCTFGTPAFGAASSGVATANAVTSDTSADASGDAGHFRFKTSGAVVDIQGTAGNSGDAPDMTFDNKSIVAGGTIAISSITVTVPIQ